MIALRGDRAPVVAFLILTFAISWSAWGTVAVSDAGYLDGINLVLFLLGGFGPAIAAVLMRFVIHRLPAPPIVGAIRRPVWVWMPLALLLGAGPYLLGSAIGVPFGEGPSASVAAETISGFGGLVPLLLLLIVAGPISEEPGWRGFAYPRIRSLSGRLQSMLILGLIWAAWHVPLFLIGGTFQNGLGLWSLGFAAFVASCVLQTYLLGHIYERGGVAAAVALHFALNASNVWLQVSQTVETIVSLITLLSLVIVIEWRARVALNESEARAR
ncbi:CPBP family intramembrane glutamic endopeptidase [Salinibacterium sp.]|uniref:CPBP family intramembrane glutamic endopeptidase n=1 Tax=Salinibacterium sp. TaxID=1915057 RepID=UPI00286CD8F2|nr:CPBP family intramembrane glutamic endopeptidase [Salinibacterium sp.]